MNLTITQAVTVALDVREGRFVLTDVKRAAVEAFDDPENLMTLMQIKYRKEILDSIVLDES